MRRVVVALRDPNPVVDGRGLDTLRRGGVEVALLDGEVARRAARQNEPFAKFVHPGLPLVTYKAAISLDGKVAAAGGDARWISSEPSRRPCTSCVRRATRSWSAPARCAATTRA